MLARVIATVNVTKPNRRLPLKNRVSDNVGSVKHFSNTPNRALRRARHFALSWKSRHADQGSLVIGFRSGDSVRGTQFFIGHSG